MRKEIKTYETSEKSAIFTFIFVLLGACAALQLAAQDKKVDETTQNKDNRDEIIRVDSNLITVPTTVTDREGRYVNNLQKKDFQIFENKIEQEVALFEPTEQPFTVLLLLDVSGSMSNRLVDLTRAANAFADQLPPDDRIMAVTFSEFQKVILKNTLVKAVKGGIKVRQHLGDRYS